jgi:hypothetical protein
MNASRSRTSSVVETAVDKLGAIFKFMATRTIDNHPLEIA